MVKKAYDMDEDDETGRENFRIKASLVERLAGRIKSYVAKHRVAVRASMLVPDFLDTMVERFADLGQNNPAAKVYHPLLLKHLHLLSFGPTIQFLLLLGAAPLLVQDAGLPCPTLRLSPCLHGADHDLPDLPLPLPGLP